MNRIIYLTNNQLNPNGFWCNPVSDNFVPHSRHLHLFDQNGYDLTELEKLYAEVNFCETESHRNHRTAIKQPWFFQQYIDEGPILNHSLLFERKGYSGDALRQLKSWTKFFSRAYQLISLRPKWGLDFSLDYVDCYGNCFEVLHWEYDGFDYTEVQEIKEKVEPLLSSIDWEFSAKQLLSKKDEWHHLDFFAQSDYKCQYFGIMRERFKMVAWG